MDKMLAKNGFHGIFVYHADVCNATEHFCFGWKFSQRKLAYDLSVYVYVYSKTNHKSIWNALAFGEMLSFMGLVSHQKKKM